tara:strand:+ start:816 stop:1364 length:549 start_codon:yes stop_codon:yes gene_type:complete
MHGSKDKIMKRLLIASFLLGLSSPIKAEEKCMFMSQYQPDITIELSTKNLSGTKGFLNYKGSPIFKFSTGIRDGYGGQYFSIDTIPNSLPKKEENIVSGSVVTIVGDQAGTKGTPENKRKRGQQKLFLPNFSLNYYHYLSLDEVNPVSLLVETEKIKSILRASEGFWIPSEICKKYVYFGWD